jgi:hypothetical protein
MSAAVAGVQQSVSWSALAPLTLRWGRVCRLRRQRDRPPKERGTRGLKGLTQKTRNGSWSKERAAVTRCLARRGVTLVPDNSDSDLRRSEIIDQVQANGTEAD